jgi:hypothetical protein
LNSLTDRRPPKILHTSYSSLFKRTDRPRIPTRPSLRDSGLFLSRHGIEGGACDLLVNRGLGRLPRSSITADWWRQERCHRSRVSGTGRVDIDPNDAIEVSVGTSSKTSRSHKELDARSAKGPDRTPRPWIRYCRAKTTRRGERSSTGRTRL